MFEVMPGAVVVHDARVVVIEQREGPGRVRVRDLATGSQTTALIAALRARDSGPVTELFDTHDERRRTVEEEDWIVARERERVIRELLEGEGPLKQRVPAAMATLGVSRRQVFTWLARFRAAGHTSGLIDKPPGRHSGRRQLDAERERIVRTAIDQHFLRQPRLKPEEIYKEAARRCREAGLPEIARGTVLARLRDLDPVTVARKRYGAKHALATVSPLTGTFAVENALDVMQIDHTQVDLHVVDETFRRPIGRPWITVATDVATRMVSGFYLTLDEPSELSVALCMAHAVLPKEAWLAERTIDVEWPAWGAPKRVHSDNGADFKGEALRRGCEDYGIGIDFRPPGRAHFGGHIERLIGTLMQRIHTLPGTSYSNPQERGDYRSASAACLTLKELEYWLTLEICVHYHGGIHQTLGTSPLVAWETAVKRGICQRMPRDARRFYIGFLPVEDRSLRRTGIHLERIRYWSDALPAIATHEDRLVVRYDPRNMSRIFVRGPGSTDYLDVPYADIRYPAVSLYEIRAARVALRAQGLTRFSDHHIFWAIDLQRAHVDEARTKTREVRRALTRRPAAAPTPESPSSTQGSINWDEDPMTYATETWSDR
jgi:putative transposase